MKLAVIIRSIGERTTELCAVRASMSFPGVKILVMADDEPFETKLTSCMEAALKIGAEWTWMLDADVALREGAGRWVQERLKHVHPLVYNVEAMVLDKFLPTRQGARPAGNHLCRTKLFRRALKYVPGLNGEVRPETYIKQRMAHAGYPTLETEDVIGVHDFFQTYYHIYWKNYLQSYKHRGRVEMLKPYWKEWSRVDGDYAVALEGVRAGIKAQEGGAAFQGVQRDRETVNVVLSQRELAEKRRIAPGQIPAYERRVQELIAVADWYDMNLKKHKK